MEKIQKRDQYQQIGKGNVTRKMDKLTLADYFQAGGTSVANFNSVTLNPEIDLKKLDNKALELIIFSLVATQRIIKLEKSNKESMIEAINKVQ